VSPVALNPPASPANANFPENSLRVIFIIDSLVSRDYCQPPVASAP